MKRSELLFSTVTLPLDYCALLLAALAAYFVRYLPVVQNFRPVIFDLPFGAYIQITTTIAAGWIIIFSLAGMYAIIDRTLISRELSRIFVACSAGLALVLAVMVFSRYLFDSRFIILAGWFFAVVFVSGERLLVRLIQRLAYRRGIGVRRVVIIGSGQIASLLSEEFSRRLGLGYHVVDQMDEFNSATETLLSDLVTADKIDEIIQVNPNRSTVSTAALVDFANEHHLEFSYTADLLDTKLLNLDIKTVAGMPLIEVKRTRLDGWGRIYKRIFDLVGATALLIILSPVLIIIAVAIKFDSIGPVFFSYRRIGQYGRAFTYFKFRSMIKDAHLYRFDPAFLAQHENVRAGSPMLKFKDDPRITRVGRFLRRWSLDELPELFLVVVGAMSLVGPRPHEVEEVGRYERRHKKLLTIRPGMTGLAQVSGRSDLHFEDEVTLDTYYIENWSLGLDWYILSKTPLAVFKRRTAA